ncbi:MAG: hypothetical protein ACO1OQ_01480 [Rufibacter sp.]
MRKLILVLGAVALLQAGCGSTKRKQVEALREEVMSLHDSTMANMGDLYTQRKTLEQLLESTEAKDTAARHALEKGIFELASADEAMMQWMRAYSPPDFQDLEKAQAYLQQEKESIKQIDVHIKQSLESADSLATLYKTK